MDFVNSTATTTKKENPAKGIAACVAFVPVFVGALYLGLEVIKAYA